MSNNLKNFRRARDPVDPPELHAGAFEGTILTEGISDSSDDLYVRLNGFDREASWGPCPWSPRVDDAGAVMYPNRDDSCLVLVSADEVPWVIAWQSS